jgi:histone H3/H4
VENLSLEAFKNLIIGTNEEIKLAEKIKIASKTMNIENFETLLKKHVKDENIFKSIMDRAQKILSLRLKNVASEEKLLTQTELYSCFHSGLVHDPKIVRRLVGFATNGNSLNSKKFISQNEVDAIKGQVCAYSKDIIEYTKHKGSKTVTSDILTQAKNRNTIMKFGYTAIGLGVAALFLSTIIPKLQYYITAKRTGKNEFPGTKN